jgi:hypothetical protein
MAPAVHGRNDNLSRVRFCLGEIDRLNNIDKHRYLHVVRHTAVALPHPWFAEYGFRSFPKWGALESNAEVDRWTFDSIPPNLAEEMEMHRQVYAEIALDEGGEHTPIFPMLHTLIYNVGRVMDRFTEWLPASPGVGTAVPETLEDAAERMRRDGALRRRAHFAPP